MACCPPWCRLLSRARATRGDLELGGLEKGARHAGVAPRGLEGGRGRAGACEWGRQPPVGWTGGHQRCCLRWCNQRSWWRQCLTGCRREETATERLHCRECACMSGRGMGTVGEWVVGRCLASVPSFACWSEGGRCWPSWRHRLVHGGARESRAVAVAQAGQ